MASFPDFLSWACTSLFKAFNQTWETWLENMMVHQGTLSKSHFKRAFVLFQYQNDECEALVAQATKLVEEMEKYKKKLKAYKKNLEVDKLRSDVPRLMSDLETSRKGFEDHVNKLRMELEERKGN
ncbi:Uncharacterized protein Fot_03821 [Forsythia ovata]|uniref:Uncharacterized protein n=1 Tax=Forsythia ovata TaxID=205694 RepID=A0ABD1XBA9_9LAMI